MQIPTVLETERGLPTKMSEDCLSLNIWAPDLPENLTDALPVMVWIHGGSFVNGSGSIPWYDGSSLAARGDVVVVTINYRLGVFGYLSLAEFGNHYDRSGNLGLLDQVAALSWIQENVAAFGGDPNRVCVVGESAGAMSIGTLLSTRAAEGLFQRAILQSGTPVAQAADRAACTTTELFAALDIDRDEAGLARLNALAAEDILNAAAQMAIRKMTAGDGDAGAFPWSPVIDGVVVYGDPMETGTTSRVPVLIGTTRDEMRIMRVLFPERPPLDLPQLEDQVGRCAVPSAMTSSMRMPPGARVPRRMIFGMPSPRTVSLGCQRPTSLISESRIWRRPGPISSTGPRLRVVAYTGRHIRSKYLLSSTHSMLQESQTFSGDLAQRPMNSPYASNTPGSASPVMGFPRRTDCRSGRRVAPAHDQPWSSMWSAC